MNRPNSKANETQNSRTTKVWMGLSFLLSFALLAWSFSLPFRKKSIQLGEDGQLETTAVQFRQIPAEELRRNAILIDDDLMEQIKERERERTRARPGLREARQRWNEHVRKIKRQIEDLGDVKEGSLEAQFKKEMLESLEDAPIE